MRKYLFLALVAGFSFTAVAQKQPAKKVVPASKPVRSADKTSVLKEAHVIKEQPEKQLLPVAPKYAATITKSDLERHLSILASDEFEGRETGKKGQKMAAEYIASQFMTNGLVPPPEMPDGQNPYYQEFELESRSWGEVYVKTGSHKAAFLKDFYSLGADIAKEESLPVVFAGYGIEEGTYSDYKNLDVTGKAVVVFTGEPVGADGKSLVTKTDKPSNWATDWRSKQRLASKKGARAILYVADGTQKDFDKTTERLHHWIEQPTMGFPDREAQRKYAMAFFLSPALGAKILQTSTKKLDNFKQQVKKTGAVKTDAFKNLPTVALKAERKKDRFVTENVLGFIEGSDLRDEIVVITAHYDHVGVQDGKVYNGADDDGSGTVALLEMAEAFAKAKAEGKGPRRSILFMPVSAEEKGLLGSEYYTNYPVLPLENTVANLNIDMIGRTDDRYKDDANYVYIIGSDRLSTDLHNINEYANKTYTKLNLDYTYNDPDDPNQFYFRSDHYNFAKNNIPIIFYFNGTHEDYHQHTDEVGKIRFDALEARTKLVFHTAWEIANRDKRPVVDKKGE